MSTSQSFHNVTTLLWCHARQAENCSSVTLKGRFYEYATLKIITVTVVSWKKKKVFRTLLKDQGTFLNRYHLLWSIAIRNEILHFNLLSISVKSGYTLLRAPSSLFSSTNGSKATPVVKNTWKMLLLGPRECHSCFLSPSNNYYVNQ